MIRIALVILALIAAVSPAAADEDQGAIVYGKDSSLYRLPMAKGSEPVEVARLNFDAADITHLTASPDGRSILISAGEVHHWVRADDRAPRTASEVCRGRATLSGDGRCVLCQGPEGLTITSLYPKRITRRLDVKGKLATLLGDKITHVVTVTDRGVEAFTIAKPRVRTLLAAQTPASDLLISPDGKRAVASFPDDQGESLYQFMLDGKGIKRKLVIDSRAVRWTQDSKWVIAAGAESTCIARARGGHYRCWKGWRAVDLSPDASEALLVKGEKTLEIARVSLAGARSAKPKTVLRGASGDALWVPLPE